MLEISLIQLDHDCLHTSLAAAESTWSESARRCWPEVWEVYMYMHHLSLYLIQWNCSIKDLWNKDTSLIRALHVVPMVSIIESFHCNSTQFKAFFDPGLFASQQQPGVLPLLAWSLRGLHASLIYIYITAFSDPIRPGLFACRQQPRAPCCWWLHNSYK